MKNSVGTKRRRAQVAAMVNGLFSAPIELLESRRYLAATLSSGRKATIPLYTPAEVAYTTPKSAKRGSDGDFAGTTTATSYAITPSVMRSAYGLNQIEFLGGIAGSGAGQTIAIVDSFDDPNALTDLNAFSSNYSLPGLLGNSNTSTINNASGPTFTKVSQTGSTTALPGTDVPYYTSGNGSWEVEESLDIEWAHVMAPQANIVLVEANGTFADRMTAVGWARAQPGIVAVSMSFGEDEASSGNGIYDTTFTTPVNHIGGASTSGGTEIAGGITFIASTGDYGIYSKDNSAVQVHYPASSRFVVAVGGTSLTVSGNTYSSETAWGNGTNSYLSSGGGGGGGGISNVEDQPAAQSGFATKFSTTKRTYPDLALDADPNTGVAIYDSFDYDDPGTTTKTPWNPGLIGGTSLAAPMMAGMVAVADQGRALKGVGSLDGINDVLPKIYSVAAADYHDITSGSNGYSPTYVASAGYDLETGRGTPIATSWIRDVAGVTLAGNVSGRVFLDNNGNGVLDAGDNVQSNVTVYYDANNNGQMDSGEPSAVSDAVGNYTISGIPANAADSIRSQSPLSNLAVLLQGVGISVAPAATGTANLAYEIQCSLTRPATTTGWFRRTCSMFISIRCWRTARSNRPCRTQETMVCRSRSRARTTT